MSIASMQLLHIPDGFLSLAISVLTWVITVVVLLVAIRKSEGSFDERLVPLAGVMAAFIFAGQMINFPVAGGTSGHLIGATLAAIVLGPWLAILVMTAVIALQALLFQDGGLLVMGANIIVMGIIPALVGFGLYRIAANQSRRLKLGTAALAAWLSVMAAALVTALLLGFSGTSSFRIAVPAMLGIHALIGIGEALITTAALSFIISARPQLLQNGASTGGRGWIVGGILVTLLVILISPFASGFPDGLEWVAEKNGFLDTAINAPFEILPDYSIPVLGTTSFSTILAGLIGAVGTAVVVWLLARRLRPTPPTPSD